MINITKQGNNVIVTSDNPNSFYIGKGELSVPLNTIYYVLDDETDFIQFNSTEEGRILFNGTIGQIQVNGNIVNRENILMELDNVFNSAATGGEGGTAGVLAINGYDGYINLKSINGQSIIGSGDITIEGGGGSTAGVEAINIGRQIQDWTQKTGVVPFYTELYDGSYDVAIGGTSFFGLKPADDTIIIEQGGGTVNGCFRGAIRVNPEVLGGGGSVDTSKFITYVGMMGDTRIAVMTDNDNLINEIYFPTINGQQILGVDGNIEISGGGITEESDPVFTSWKDGTSIVAGQNAVNGTESFGVLIPKNNVVVIGNNAKVQYDGGVAIGNGATVIVGSINGVAIGSGVSTDGTFSTNINNVIKGDANKNAYIKNSNGTYTKILDLLPKEWTGTQAEYDALGTYDDNTTYNIIEG